MLDLLSQWTKGEKNKQQADPKEKAANAMQFNNKKIIIIIIIICLSVFTMEIREMNTSLKNKIKQVSYNLI